MIKNVKTKAKDTKSCVGGDCCVPIAILRNAKTITSLAKLVMTKTSEGAKIRSVKTTKTFIDVTSCSGLFGADSDRFTVGTCTTSPKTDSEKSKIENKIFIKLIFHI